MALTAAIVVTASIAVERNGPFIGALIATLPTAAGAAYIILALEHPPPSSPRAPSVPSRERWLRSSRQLCLAGAASGVAISISVAALVWFCLAALRLIHDSGERAPAQCAGSRCHYHGPARFRRDAIARRTSSARAVARADGHHAGCRSGDERKPSHRSFASGTLAVFRSFSDVRGDPAFARRRQSRRANLAHAQAPLSDCAWVFSPFTTSPSRQGMVVLCRGP
jgi:hypothetical protein